MAQPDFRGLASAPMTESWFSAWRMRCSSCQRSASDSPDSTRSSSACASSSCCCARSSSICVASTASSTSASARSCSTLKKPGPVANSRTSPPRRRCTRVEPALSIATSGACRASTPISPAAPGHDQHLGLALERRAFRRHERDRERPSRRRPLRRRPARAQAPARRPAAARAVLLAAHARPFSTASSIVPTM